MHLEVEATGTTVPSVLLPAWYCCVGLNVKTRTNWLSFCFSFIHTSDQRTPTLWAVEKLSHLHMWKSVQNCFFFFFLLTRPLPCWFLHQWKNTQASMMTTSSQWGKMKQSVQSAMKSYKTKCLITYVSYAIEKCALSQKTDQNQINEWPKWGIPLDRTPYEGGWNQQDRPDNHRLYKIRANMISPERKFDCLGQQTSRQEGKQTGDGSKRSLSYKSEHVLHWSLFFFPANHVTAQRI